MHATSAPDFRLYPSNALDTLAALLAEELRRPVPEQPVLQPEVVLIPQVAMRRWLQSTLAAEHGVAANLEFLTPGEFVARALERNLGPADDDLDMATTQWRLYQTLQGELGSDAALAPLAGYLADGDALKPWALAGELGSVFEKYQAWRRDWLLRWESGADADDPQARLWRSIAGGRQYRARRIGQYLDRYARPDGPLPQGLPKRLFAFAILNVSPDVLRVLATQARVGTLHFYLPTPTQGYWGDLQTLWQRRREGGAVALFAEQVQENPLLQAWGAAGRDFMALVGDYEVVHPLAEIAAYADPLDAGRRTLAEGGLGDSLLRRMQSDLFHRHAPAVPPVLPAVNLHDPSLQVHACHTRLRELQVLHDQLRALLDDARFDPPLQPREIAVLSPDIDPYVPYLDAVFGGHGSDDGLPYALADASPLASEPLADVFLTLLGLPISRFGLHEILDLLASAPIAEAAGLDEAGLERLRGWLHGAGARWGLDAVHRRQHQAPGDDAYTWRFALDRLLLGHASGAEDDIDGVAPWPQLEGSALAALDTLLRLLRVLDRHQAALAEAMTPVQWRECLLGLLEALIPKAPSAPRAQRALERLRTLIDQFARDAVRAEYAGNVPAEVVRAHFAAVLGESDTRAPLLTGGISFGRMVPMRLLPFRAICLLGMNDGDFPRRDPAAGLNRLTAELGTERRRHGDRSTREDDRFLFLQLFASAQEVFYLSYLGADARDGTVREPSVLVSELLGSAAQYHADPGAIDALVVRHPLQPFAAAAFGAVGEDGADPRRFSYRRQWRPAVDSLAGQRQPLAPWVAGALPVDPSALPASVSIDDLRRLFADPAGQFLRHRLGMRLPDPAGEDSDLEPLLAPTRGLEQYGLQQQVFDAALAGDADGLYERLRARALLPSGPLGRRQLDERLRQLRPYADVFRQWRGDEPAQSHRLQVEIDGTNVHGRVPGWYANGVGRVQVGALSGRSAIRDGLEWLLLRAAGERVPFVRFFEHNDSLGPHPIDPEPLSQTQARAALAELLQLYRHGLQTPLAFAPYSSWKYHQAARNDELDKAIKDAHGQWQSSFGWSESHSPELRLVTRGRDPFGDAQQFVDFARTSHQLFALLEHGSAPEPLDPARVIESWRQWRGAQDDAE
ncbi:exodeoxyribonuclease V subunit gamma [Xanthomonas campestris]|uniref:RecBCD enzyme subunit RecC n=2 Tax=Xanthomonas campestris TaxID=339 RepID=B0RMI0_XANCB|nr:exodeoxyribonuclease V subunit gamma [Xanthomonas campestris]MEA9475789.1 exodeoxyribonuclease V subunit gamma [Xanthomonas campestris]MEB1643577.1 exodeoxyribonuclease V subunit gamma [Xanthomonas campestris pv. campestris]MEB1688759.1 exodeoxyribonuclease V subunit gamma [Xanthomonas campestris pv. campestris]MEB1992212.1 exodeoxyribonuclease V subunit gamma [Xanthomonas campestris pv. campestris]CAP53793.1 exodeoxyribonuclease V gamma chain [Xanthomonas campestris pv. campestris]